VIVTFTLGITAPEGSVTVPTSVAVCAKAQIGRPTKITLSITKRRRLKFLVAGVRRLTHFDETENMFHSSCILAS
jgi:hypothetical protein